MRISDWSSDVCSSDLGGHGDRHARAVGQLSPDLLSGRPHQLGDEAVQDLGGCLLSRLVVGSNRVSAAKQTRPGAEGGLSVAVRAALRERGGIWFGWSGKVAANDYGEPTVTEAGKITYATIDLTQRDYDEYYVGFANSTLWPLFHYRLDLAVFQIGRAHF